MGFNFRARRIIQFLVFVHLLSPCRLDTDNLWRHLIIILKNEGFIKLLISRHLSLLRPDRSPVRPSASIRQSASVRTSAHPRPSARSSVCSRPFVRPSVVQSIFPLKGRPPVDRCSRSIQMLSPSLWCTRSCRFVYRSIRPATCVRLTVTRNIYQPTTDKLVRRRPIRSRTVVVVAVKHSVRAMNTSVLYDEYCNRKSYSNVKGVC